MSGLCEWCDEPIPAVSAQGRATRRDARYCRKACRQQGHRFRRSARGPARPVADGHRAFQFAYADPPYPGKAHLYRDHEDYAGEVDHRELVERLTSEYPDGWALSTSSDALWEVLALCPRGARVGPWVRGERAVDSYYPLNAWEPVIYFGGRPYRSRLEQRRIDVLVHRAAPRRGDPKRVIGAKPAEFCRWLFDLLGALPGDEFDDLYPGSGRVGDAWRAYTGADRSPSAAEADRSRRPRASERSCSPAEADRSRRTSEGDPSRVAGVADPSSRSARPVARRGRDGSGGGA